MSNEEVNPLSGTVVVSSHTEEPPQRPRRSRGLDRSVMSAEELRQHKRGIDAKHRNGAKEKKVQGSLVYSSALEPKEPEAKEILAARGLNDPHVIDVCYQLALKAAEQAGVPANRFLFHNGIAKTLQSYALESPQLLDAAPDETVAGELSNRAELVCLHDFSIGWREDAFDFPEFLRLRRVCKTDAYELGLLLGKDFEECQKNWTEFLPRFNPDTLPSNYTQKEMRQWLDATSPVKDYLLMASRNSMKSSFVLVWLLTLHLCCPDARALLVSETQKLSSGFIRSYRNYWEVGPEPTALQRLFPEYCITPGEGSEQYFRSPMAHLNLIQPSASKTSAESAETGNRAEVLIFDDVISNLTVGTDAQIEKSINIYDLLQKLREVLGSFSIVIGTPWAPADLYATLLKRAEGNDDALAFRIDPIITVKPHAREKLKPARLGTLTEDDVESYLLPVRMPWRFVKSEIGKNPTFALSQNFCIFPTDEDAALRCQFEHDDLWARAKPASYFGKPLVTQTVMALDRAFSISRFADLSAICVGKVQTVDEKAALVVVDCVMDRYKESELVKAIVDLIAKHHPDVLVFERDKGWQELSDAIKRECARKGVSVPWIRVKDVKNTEHAKARRAKLLELPLADGRLWFVSNAGTWAEPLFLQFEKFTGLQKSNTVRKDDGVDAVSLLFSEFGPKYTEELKPEDLEERRRMEEEEGDRLRQQHFRDAMFGTPPQFQPRKASDFLPGRKQPPPVVEEQKIDPRLKVFGRGPWRM